MRLHLLPGGGIRVSRLALGTMNFGADWHGIGAVDERTARDMVDLAADRGVNFIDTADIYGRGASEALLGKILRGRRDRFVIATKVLGRMRPDDPSSGGLSARHIAEAIDDSLRRLKTDWVDLYMCHGADPSVPLEETLEAFDRVVRAGKARLVGCSNLSGGELLAWMDAARAGGWAVPCFNQVQYSLAARSVEWDPAPFCGREGIAVLAWSPLGGGLLSGKYSGAVRPAGRRQDPAKAFPRLAEARLEGVLRVLEQVARLEGRSPAQTALGWLLGKPWLASAVIGARTLEQLRENLESEPLSAKAQAFLDKASEIDRYA